MNDFLTLQDNDYERELRQHLRNSETDYDTMDVSIATRNPKDIIKCHSWVLRMASNYCDTLLREEGTGGKLVIAMRTATKYIAKKAVVYMYNGMVIGKQYELVNFSFQTRFFSFSGQFW